METDVHELTGAYALDALDPVEERRYEEHLARCSQCREDLAAFQETAAALAYAPEAPAPPAALRARLLEQARHERSNVVVLRPRRLPLVLASASAVAAAAAAIVLGIWASSLSSQLDEERSAREVLADPAARSVALEGLTGRLVVGAEREAVLVVAGLRPAPGGKTYEVWVIERAMPRRAGLFDGGETPSVVKLDERVPPGAVVAVTVERDGGVDTPTGDPILTARA